MVKNDWLWILFAILFVSVLGIGLYYLLSRTFLGS